MSELKLRRLAIVTTHPIQYNAPLFALLNKRDKIKLKVFYTLGNTSNIKYDPGFGKEIEWDIPFLTGYDYTFVNNVSPRAGSQHFKGINNPTLVNEILAWQADAVLVYGWSFKSHLKAMRFFHGKIPVFFRGDSTLLASSNWIKRISRLAFLGWVYTHIDYALYVGSYNKDYFEALGLKESQLVFAPHAIDNDRFKLQSETLVEKAAAWNKSLGIEEDHFVMLYAGKLDENKNVALAAEAFLKVTNARFHFIIAGNGVTEQSLKEKYSRYKNIHFLPFQNQSVMPLLYHLADVFILPSLSETWGLSINEAMACGKAILASAACGCTADLVKDEINGYVFKSNDVNDLHEKMQFLQSKKKLAAMGQQSLEIITPWNFENICIAIEKITGD